MHGVPGLGMAFIVSEPRIYGYTQGAWTAIEI